MLMTGNGDSGNMVGHENCTKRLERTIHRIHRIQGQLSALERDIQIKNDCEYLVTRAIAIEKAVGSLILHLMEEHLDHHVTPVLEQEPKEAVRDVKRLFQLVTR